jgi:diguanylate cyclase (GGDEF)-like protein
MNTVRDLRLLPVWVNPQHLASTALHIMLGHKVKSLGVLGDGKLVGILTLEDLLKAKEDTRVADLMHAAPAIINAEMNVRDAAQAFVNEDLDSAPVLRKGDFQGMLTPVMLLKELGRSYDPLTKLSWSDRLREWGINQLEQNEEVTIIFIDLNRFGLYNKKYGHIIGDMVIAKVASFLQSQIDPELDVLVRYGGDEFAIGTLRDRAESDALAELLSKRFDGKIEGAEEPVSFSTGVFGGRRGKERESTHYAATIDNLINIASKNCIANKKRERGEETPDKPKAIEFSVLGIYADEGDDTGIITVILSGAGNVYSGAESKRGRTVVESISSATAHAIERAAPRRKLTVLAIDLLEEDGAQVVSVTGLARTGDVETAVSAAKRVTGDLATIVVEATIRAFSF